MVQAHKRIAALIFASSLFLIMGGCATTGDTDGDDVSDTQPEQPRKSFFSSDDSYTVSRGDNLWNISGRSRIYGNPYQWPLIYKANSDKIKDADLIYPGQIFDINRRASSSEIDAAVRHAKSRGAWTLGETEASDRQYLRR